MANDLNIKVGADITDLINQLNRSSSEIKEFGEGVKKIGEVLGIAFGVEQIKEFTFQLSELAVKGEGVKNAFSQIPQSTQLLSQMRETVHGTVTDLNLMKDAIHAENLGIPLQNLGTILEFVHQRALATGQDFNNLAESILTGIGRGSTRAMTSLEISTERVNEEVKKTGSFMSAVMKIAQEEIEKTSGKMSESTLLIEQNGVAWENLKMKLGQYINQSTFVSGLLKNMHDQLIVWQSDQIPFWEKVFGGDGDYARFVQQIEKTGKMKEELAAWNEEMKTLQSLVSGKLLPDITIVSTRLQTINSIQKEITRLKEEEKEATGEELSNIQAQIMAENEKLKVLQNQYIEQQRIAQGYRQQQARESAGTPELQGAVGFKPESNHIEDSLGKQNKALITNMETTGKLAKEWKSAFADMAKDTAANRDELAKMNDSGLDANRIGQDFSKTMTNVFSIIISGSGSATQAIGQMVESFGLQMLTMALSAIIADAVNPDSNGGNYYLGLALAGAGIAAVGAMFAGIGVGGGSSNASAGGFAGTVGGNHPGTGYNPSFSSATVSGNVQTVNVVGKISGRDIVLVQSKQNYYDGRTVSVGG